MIVPGQQLVDPVDFMPGNMIKNIGESTVCGLKISSET